MLGRAEMICSVVEAPLIADADTGYGGLLNVQRTVRGYEAAGVAAIQIEDQEMPKKCGHTRGGAWCRLRTWCSSSGSRQRPAGTRRR